MRSWTTEIGGMEKQTGYAFLYVFIACAIAAPIFHYISNKLEKHAKGMDEI
jgi:hypothetical protein